MHRCFLVSMLLGVLYHRTVTSHRLQAATGLESQGSGYGRGGGDDYFEDDLPNVVFLHKLGFLNG